MVLTLTMDTDEDSAHFDTENHQCSCVWNTPYSNRFTSGLELYFRVLETYVSSFFTLFFERCVIWNVHYQWSRQRYEKRIDWRSILCRVVTLRIQTEELRVTVRDSRVLVSCNTNLLNNLILFCLFLPFLCYYDTILVYLFTSLWLCPSFVLFFHLDRRFESKYSTIRRYDTKSVIYLYLFFLICLPYSILFRCRLWSDGSLEIVHVTTLELLLVSYSVWIHVWVSMSWHLTSWISMLSILLQEKSRLSTRAFIFVWLSVMSTNIIARILWYISVTIMRILKNMYEDSFFPSLMDHGTYGYHRYIYHSTIMYEKSWHVHVESDS